MDSDYNITDAYNGGAEGVLDTLKDLCSKYYWVVLGLLVVLTIVIIYLLATKEGFNPTRHLRFQDSDQYGLGYEKFERGKLLPGDPTIPAGQPGSAAYNVLSSSDFNCSNRKPSGENAWDWMAGVAYETFSSLSKPPNDNTFSRTLSGY